MIILSVGESKPRKFKLFAKLIMAVEGTNHSHTFISWKDKALGIRKLAEARGSGSRIITNTQFKKDNEVVNIYYYNVLEEDLLKLEKWIWQNAGPYGYKHILGLLLMRICQGFKRFFNLKCTTKNPFKDGVYSQICVELTSRAIEIAKNIDLPGEVEDYGLKEMHEINKQYADSTASQRKINRVNNK